MAEILTLKQILMRVLYQNLKYIVLFVCKSRTIQYKKYTQYLGGTFYEYQHF